MKSTKRFLLIVSVFSITLSSFAKESFVEYHKKIFDAEKLIAQNEYDSAFLVYQSIFSYYPHAFYKDLHNACICACKTGDLKNASLYAEKLVLQGYEMDDFNNTGFVPLKENKRVWNKFLKKHPLLREQYNNSLNHELRKKYYDLFVSDQKAAKPDNSLHSQDSVFYQQAVKLSIMFQEQGFPSLDLNKDTINIKIFAMLRHYFGLANRFNLNEEMQCDSFYTSMNFKAIQIDTLVLEALYNGRLLPQTYVDATSYFAGNPYGNLAIKIDFDKETVGFHINMKPEQVEEINKRREKIGLFPIQILSNEIFKSTWYNEYPFKEIKEAFLKCNACEMGDYVTLKKMEEDKVRNRFILKKDNEFILFDFNQIKETWNTGIDKYMKTN